MAKKQTVEWIKEGVGYVDVTLSRPAEVAGAKVSSVRMREPTVADQEVVNEVDGSDATREIHAFANLCQLAPDDIRKLPMRDYLRLQVAYRTFID